jgi:hypothetical protein
MNWHFWRDSVLEKSDIDHKSFRSAFRLGTYTSTQFKPAVAKLMYQMHDATSVIDFSCGWGDRLAGFYATPNTKFYFGCDPNPDTFEAYKKQCVDYERFLGNKNPILQEGKISFQCIGKKAVVIFNCAAEDLDWSSIQPCHDIVFTSPPYFETEKYGQGGERENSQSWFRYKTFDKWRDKFLFNVLSKVWGTIREGGYMAINIVDPIHKNKRLPLCDDMVEFCSTLPECNYVGKIMMELWARPRTNLTEIVGEPIWMFRKSTDKYFRPITLDQFF